MNKDISNKAIEEKAKELKRKYHREWQRNNKDKVEEYKNRYWNKKAEEELKEA